MHAATKPTAAQEPMLSNRNIPASRAATPINHHRGRREGSIRSEDTPPFRRNRDRRLRRACPGVHEVSLPLAIEKNDYRVGGRSREGQDAGGLHLVDGRRNCRAEWSDSGRLCQLMEHSRLLAAEGDEAKSPEECSLAGNGEQFPDPAFTSPFDATLDEF